MNTQRFRALSIQQPWAELIMSGLKDVENRHWSTSFRGPLLIHASKQLSVEGYDLYPHQTNRCLRADDLGAVVGSVFLYNCTQKQRSDWHEDGLFGWYLADPVRLPQHIKLTGRLQLFEVGIADMASAILCHRCKANLPGENSGLCGCCHWWLQNNTEKIAPELPREHHAYQEYLVNKLVAEGRTV